MDSQSSVHVYGQVWHIVDPICGSKESGTRPPVYSAIVHNNRYGVIAQRTETITGSSILMIPCSTSNSIPHDVNFSIMTERRAAGRVRALYPVHPRCLDRYVCTLSPHIMKKIEVEIIKLLCPTICLEHESGRFDVLDLDTDRSAYEKIATRINPANARSVIESFVQEKIQFTGNVTDLLDIVSLKTTFDEYCIPKGYEILDMLEFIGYFQEQYGREGAKPLTELMEIRHYPGMVIKMNETEPSPPAPPVVTVMSAKKWNKWTDERIEEFVEYYRKFGADDTAKAYNILPTTAKVYYSQWDSQPLDDDGEEEFKPPSTKNIIQNILKFSNFIRDVLHEEDVFVNVYKHVKGKQKIFADTFYKRVQQSVYTSLIEFLNIKRVGDTEFNFPEIKEDSEYLQTWRFLEVANNSGFVTYAKGGVKGREYIENARKEFNVTGIHCDWLSVLSPKLLKVLDLTKGGLEHMSQIIQDCFCDQETKKEEGNNTVVN